MESCRKAAQGKQFPVSKWVEDNVIANSCIQLVHQACRDRVIWDAIVIYMSKAEKAVYDRECI